MRIFEDICKNGKSKKRNIKGSAGIEIILWTIMGLMFMTLPLLLFLVEFQNYDIAVNNSKQIVSEIMENLKLQADIQYLSEGTFSSQLEDLKYLIKTEIDEDCKKYSLKMMACDIEKLQSKESQWCEFKIIAEFSADPVTQIGRTLAESGKYRVKIIEKFELPIDR